MGIQPIVRQDGYLRVVEEAREHIASGDVYEVCTCNAYETESSASGSALYRALSGISPAPFAAYLRFPEVEVISSSPERFMRLDRDRWAETRPVKGTRPRGASPEEDERNRNDLASSAKDNAENVMIVDVARNDLGRVCRFGTVSVPELRVIESYPLTHQLVSTVRGQLAEGKKPMDLIRASFPGGSMTGAPKIEAMKIIDRLEPIKRGIFSGAIGYLDFDGALDFNIVIRTLVKKGKSVSFHVGGAIVSDSDPSAEFQELMDKAHGMVIALELAAMDR
jgi:para-aminobenzoate synthetase component 1